MAATILDADDLSILREIVRAYKQRKRGGVARTGAPDDDPPAPDCYIALVPSTGIPPLDEPGTGTGSSASQVGDLPGSRDCGIYFLANGVLSYAGFTLTVYNLGNYYIPAGWKLIHRDKFGTWIADRSAVIDVRCVSGSIVVTRG